MTDLQNQRSSSLRLWQLISPTLPVGAYAYSQGLEYAIDCGWITDEAGAARWIKGLVSHSLARLDVPVLSRLHHAWANQDMDSVKHWNQFLLASRESSEILAEDQQLGAALHILLNDLEVKLAALWDTDTKTSYANMFALGATDWEISLNDTVNGYCWAWCENQVAAAIKLVPLGQTAGQRILSQLIGSIEEATNTGLALADDDIGIASQGLGIASALHETQYSRLFRS